MQPVNIPEQSDPDAGLVEQPRPATGQVLLGYTGSTPFTVHASGDSDFFVKLKDSDDNTLIGFYVRAGETATVYVPGYTAWFYFASGDTWYGTEHAFGSQTYYAMDDGGALDLYNYSYEYTLYGVSGGNFSPTQIDEDTF